MPDRLSRQAFLRRAAAGGSLLTVPGLLAACGGGGGGSSTAAAAAGGGSTTAAETLPKTITFSNWPLYIDVNEKKKTHPSLQQFERAHPGTTVRYIEDINDNDSFFGKIEGPLSQGQKVGRDLVVLTDSSGLPQRMIQLGWLEQWDKSAMPNFKNLQPSLAHPSWDEDRSYSLPWQSGMTGIGYDPDKVGYEIDSVDKLLTDPKLKGKVTLLTEMADTMGLVMLANGDDPSHVTKKTWDAAVARIKAAVESGQVRQFTGNDYAPLLAKGDVWACFAWSGDMVQLQADHPGLKWAAPTTGAMIWTDQMLIPKGGNAYAASVLADWFYKPDIAAEVEDYVNYICPVQGAAEVLEKSDPAVAKNPLIFPPASLLAKTHMFDGAALNDSNYKQDFQNLIGA
ncbi:MAG TPA: spermidine/putrescine ABC transporter substrate-binding protein [Gaiellaceae bacterium]|nr:spermidine/putrescine ABC transporter substrate-binding protein [Gaiellaceae bacterium]